MEELFFCGFPNHFLSNQVIDKQIIDYVSYKGQLKYPNKGSRKKSYFLRSMEAILNIFYIIICVYNIL